MLKYLTLRFRFILNLIYNCRLLNIFIIIVTFIVHIFHIILIFFLFPFIPNLPSYINFFLELSEKLEK